MNTEIITIDKYTLKTYQIDDHLSVTIAYDSSKQSLPANGGLRFCKYENLKEAQDEALTLARKMTQKHKIYDTGFSGVKLVANGEINSTNKLKVLNTVAEILNKFKGKIYTGCDLNINNKDMEYLFSITPYVLNGIGSSVNTSTATAYGVYGSLIAVMRHENKTNTSCRFLIHGTGKIGSVIADQLIKQGHTVYTFDANKESANIDGAINISGKSDWYQVSCDYMVLCSKSGVIDTQNAEELNCNWIISSANAPFANEKVNIILKEKKINWIPDVISNAGAVICDSLEFINQKKYQLSDPKKVYQFVYNAKLYKTKKILALSHAYRITPNEALQLFFSIAENENILEAKLGALVPM